MTAGPTLDLLAPDDLPALFAAAPAALLVLRPDAPAFTIVAATDAYLQATHQTRDALVGRPVFDALPDANPGNPAPTGIANLRASLEAVLRTGAPHAMPVQRYDLRRPDGTWEERHWAPRNSPVLGPDGAVQYLVHYVEDVTERVCAETERARLTAEVAAERERLRAVLLQAPTPMALLEGPEHRLTLVNDAYQRVSGGGRDLTGLTFRAAFPELEGQPFFVIQDRAYATGEPWAASAVPVRYDRLGTGVEDAYFDLRYEPVRDAAGRVFALLNYGVDVTEQTRARREVERLLAESEAANVQLQEQAAELEVQAEVLQATAAELEARTEAADRARAEAEAANRAKGDFLAVMSHELRTPLNAIGGYAQLMELGLQGPVTPDQLAALGRIQRGQQHLLGLINAVLNYAKLEAGHVQYHPAPVPAAELLAEAAALVAPQARAKGLALEVVPCAPDLVARADGEKVGQVLLNLLSNAVKFTRGGGAVTVAGARTPDGRVALTVADTGRGIAADQLSRVFEPFVQVDQRLTRAEEGTGLGLAISRDLARGMGGDLTVESTLGVGSTFTLTLPVGGRPPAASESE